MELELVKLVEMSVH